MATGAASASAAPANNVGTRVADLAEASSSGAICYQAHVQKYGWLDAVCDGAIEGTMGQSLRLEALDIAVTGVGTVCARAHVQDLGWQAAQCASDAGVIKIGTTGRSLAIEAVEIWRLDDGLIGADAHLHGTGWQGWRWGSDVTVGTVGQSRPMEAIELGVV